MSPHSEEPVGLRFWLSWIAANALGELIGLGTTASVTVGAFMINDRLPLWLGLALGVGVALVGGVVEGGTVGTAQWLVLRRALPAMRWRSWALATAVGGFIAWVLGMLPSTIMSATAHAATAATAAGGSPADIPDAVQLVLAAAMGLFVLGPILGVPQWRVLRRFVPRAGWWVLANGVAWAVGMPLVFLGVQAGAAGGSPWRAIAAGALSLLAAGAAVGAVHGAAMVWLLRGRPGIEASPSSPI